MVRVILGSVVAAIAMLVVGFLLYATPLNSLGTGKLGNAEAAAVQDALKGIMPGTGTYEVPSADTAEQTARYGQGPIATIHYNANGYPAGDASMFLSGLILNFFAALLMGLGLIGIDRRVPDFGSRARLVVPFSIAAALFIHVTRPVYLHHDWSNAIFSLFGDALALAVGGLVVAWFLPRHRADVARSNNAPTET